MLGRSALRIALTTISALAALLVRLALVQRFGIELPAFMTFYPVIMVVALLFGLWLGLLATVLSAVLAAIWVFPPSGQFRVASTSDIVALALFLCLGVFMSLVAERYRRNQLRITAFEKDLALRETREQLQQVKEYHRLALEAAELGAWEYRFDTRELSSDQCGRDVFGFSPGDTLDYEAVMARIHSEDRSAVDGAVKQAIAQTNDGVFYQEFRVVRPDGSIHWVSSHGRVYFDGQGGKQRAARFIGVSADTTGRKRADDALRASESRYSGLAESIPAMLWAADAQGMRIDQNRRWLEYTGQTHEQALGTDWQAVVFPGDIQRVLEVWGHSKQTGEDYLVEYRIRRASDETYRWHRVHAKLQKDMQGRPLGWFGESVDIEDQKRAEEQLQVLNRTLKAVSNSNQALMHATDEPAFLQEVCRIITEDCGHAMVWIGSAEDDQNKTVRPLACSGFEDGYLATLRINWDSSQGGRGPTGTAIRTGEPSMCRNMLTDPAFSPWRENAVKRGYASSLAIPLKDGRRTIGAITIYSRKPDAFYQGEIDLLMELAGDIEFGVHVLRIRAAHERAEDALKNSERLYRGIGESIDYGVWVCAPDGRNTYASDSFLKLVGMTQQQCSDFGWGNVLHPEDAERTIAAWKKCVQTEGVWDIEQRFRGVDGQWHPVLTRGVPVRDDRGQLLAWAGINLDISNLKRAELALLRSEKLASVGRLAASMAHEINNPLAAVTNVLFLAQTVENLPEAARLYLETADAELRRIAHITQQSLGFYRESNAPASVSVHAVLKSAVDLMKSKIGTKRAVIEMEWDRDPKAVAVAGELRQVFSNLLANSLDAIDESGTIKLRVHAGTNLITGHRSVRVTVADNGKGICEDSRQHLFEPFFTTKGAVGTGLGLWVSKQIVDKHCGSIRLRSRTSGARRGTVFSVELPAEPPATATTLPECSPATLNGSASSGRNEPPV